MQQTRGVAGFYDGEPKLIYQNDNAEPYKLGINILNELRGYDLASNLDFLSEHVLMDFHALDESEPATAHHKQSFRRHLPRELVREDARTIYDLFEPVQGTLKPYLDGLIQFYPDGSDFIEDSHFCKWGYVLNLDNRRFEILRGDQTENGDEELVYGHGEPQPLCKVYNGEDLPYFACEIVKAYDIGHLPSHEQFLRDMEEFK